jgi:hypothetical protein
MRLKEQTSIFNMGDTSIRVKEVVLIYKQVLKTLNTHIIFLIQIGTMLAKINSIALL